MVGPGRLLSKGRPRKPAQRRLNTISGRRLAEHQARHADWSTNHLDILQSGSQPAVNQDAGAGDDPDDCNVYNSAVYPGSGEDPWVDEDNQVGGSRLQQYLHSSRFKQSQVIEQENWASILPAIFSEYMRCAQLTSLWGHATSWQADWKVACDCIKRKRDVDIVDFVGGSISLSLFHDVVFKS